MDDTNPKGPAPEAPRRPLPRPQQARSEAATHEPVPAVQAEYLRQLSEEAGEPVEELANQADACRRMRELQEKVGRVPRIIENEQTDG